MTTNISAPPKPKPEVIRPAKLPSEVLIERGWCSTNWWDGDGRVCLFGATVRANLKQPQIDGITNSLVAVMSEQGIHGVREILRWNDAAATFDDVLAVCREAERRLQWRD